MIFYVVFRYREPIMPLLCILAAVALERLIKKWQAHRVGADATPIPT